MAVFLSQGYIEFAFDAGDGVTVVKSPNPLAINRWHRVRVTRTGLLAEIQVNDRKRVAQLATGAFTQVIPFANQKWQYILFALTHPCHPTLDYRIIVHVRLFFFGNFISLYGLIRSCTIINFRVSYNPVRLFHPVRLFNLII